MHRILIILKSVDGFLRDRESERIVYVYFIDK